MFQVYYLDEPIMQHGLEVILAYRLNDKYQKMFRIMFTKRLVKKVFSLILYEKISYFHLYLKLKRAQNTLFQLSMISNVLFFLINSLS